MKIARKNVSPRGGSLKGKYLFAKPGGAEYRPGPPPVTSRKTPEYLRRNMMRMAPYPGMMQRYDAYADQKPNLNLPTLTINVDSGPPGLLTPTDSSPGSTQFFTPTSSVGRSPDTPFLPGAWPASPPVVQAPPPLPPPQRPMMTEVNPNTILQTAILTQGMQAQPGKTFFTVSTQTGPIMSSMSTQAGPTTESMATQASASTTTTSTQATDSQVAELKKELENYHKILTETVVDVEKVVSLNESLADLLRTSQSESSSRQQVLEKTFKYLGTFIDQVVGDTRWRDLLNKDASADEQVQQILGLVSSRDPKLREFVKKVGFFAEKILEVRDKAIQTEPEGVMGRPKRKTLASKGTGLDVQPRTKRIKTTDVSSTFTFKPSKEFLKSTPAPPPLPENSKKASSPSSPVANRTRSKKKDKKPPKISTDSKKPTTSPVSPVANRTRSKKKDKK